MAKLIFLLLLSAQVWGQDRTVLVYPVWRGGIDTTNFATQMQRCLYTVSWCINNWVSDPCPDANKKDEWGRVFRGYNCGVLHGHTEKDGGHIRILSDRDSAWQFYERSVNQHGMGIVGPSISDVKIDSCGIDITPKPKESGRLDSLTFYRGDDVTVNADYRGFVTMTDTIETIGLKSIFSSGTIITDTLLFDYAKECYDDSSESCYPIGCEIDKFGRVAKLNYWIHKDPTFSGFIEYLRRKTK